MVSNSEMSGQPVDVACTEDSCKSPIARESAGTDGEGGRRGLRQQTTCLKSDPIKSSMSRKVSRGEREPSSEVLTLQSEVWEVPGDGIGIRENMNFKWNVALINSIREVETLDTMEFVFLRKLYPTP